MVAERYLNRDVLATSSFLWENALDRILSKNNFGYKIMYTLWPQHLKGNKLQKVSVIGENRHLYKRRVQGGLKTRHLVESLCKEQVDPSTPFLRNSTSPSHFHDTSLLPSWKVQPLLSTKDFCFSKSTSRSSNIISCLLLLWGRGLPCARPSPRHHHWNLCWLPLEIWSHGSFSSKIHPMSG